MLTLIWNIKVSACSETHSSKYESMETRFFSPFAPGAERSLSDGFDNQTKNLKIFFQMWRKWGFKEAAHHVFLLGAWSKITALNLWVTGLVLDTWAMKETYYNMGSVRNNINSILIEPAFSCQLDHCHITDCILNPFRWIGFFNRFNTSWLPVPKQRVI